MHRLLVICFSTILVCCSCAAAPPKRVDLALKRLETAVEAYGRAHPRDQYPRSLAQLSAFASSIGKPLDLTPFSKIALERPRRTFMSISYEAHDSADGAGVLAYSAGH
jgi:hypothetical protein